MRRKDSASNSTSTLAEQITERIRQKILSGTLTPRQHLSELALGEELGVSRNTLREAFRSLTREGLLRHESNRGVFVASPDMSSIVDIYRVRRVIECPILARAHPRHPAVDDMRAAVKAAIECRSQDDWVGVGSADMAFHAAIVDLGDSPRLTAIYHQLSLELRLVFGLLDDPASLHAPFVDQNDAIVSAIEEGDAQKASTMLEAYLLDAERLILGAYTRTSQRP